MKHCFNIESRRVATAAKRTEENQERMRKIFEWYSWDSVTIRIANHTLRTTYKIAPAWVAEVFDSLRASNV